MVQSNSSVAKLGRLSMKIFLGCDGSFTIATILGCSNYDYDEDGANYNAFASSQHPSRIII